MVLPTDVRGRAVEGFDASGLLIDRCWLASSLSRLDASIDHHEEQTRQAAARPPEVVRRLLERVSRSRLPAVTVGAPHHVVERLDHSELLTRWPIRPLFLPPRSVGQGPGFVRWDLLTYWLRVPINQIVSIGLTATISPGPRPAETEELSLADGSIIMSQSVVWMSGHGSSDAPNTEVRGRPARLNTFTIAENGFDELTISWSEDAAGLEAPLRRIGVVLRASPLQHGSDELFQLANELQRIDQ